MKTRISVTGVSYPLLAAIKAVATDEGKTLAQLGVEALEMLARDRKRWPPQPKEQR